MTDPSRLAKGALAGLVGGLVGSWVMTQFQTVLPAETFKDLLGEVPEQAESESEESPEDKPATVEAADRVSEAVLGHELPPEDEEWAGLVTHYAFGSSSGAAYGLLAEAVPGVTTGGGLAFGAGLWLLADEGAVPALGLSDAPWEHPPSTHLYALTSHLVYGVTAEIIRRAVRAAL